MTLLSDVLLGVQRPQIVHLPPDVHSLGAATEAIELADAYGIADGHPLDESQRFTLQAALGERADGSWAAATVADFEPRQNGKNDTCAARELAGLILFGEQLIIHTAHEFPTANESFLRLVSVFENWDDLRKRVQRIRYANGEQGIELISGQRLKYRARTGGSGRGFAKADLTVYDEAQHLQAEHVAASGPAKLANPNSQSWYMGSGGLSSSANAWRMRKRALSGDGGRLCYVEHTAEVISLDADGRVVSIRPDPLDRLAWARANSAYGFRIEDEKLLDLFGELGPDLFARECLCVWDPLPGDDGELQLPLEPWIACRDDRSVPVDPVVFGLASSEDRRWSSIVVAAHTASGRRHIEVVDRREGVMWLTDAVRSLRLKWGAEVPVVVLPGTATGSVIDEMAAVGVVVSKVGKQQFAAHCAAFVDGVKSGVVAHRNDVEFGPALVAARRQQVAEGWCWRAKDASSDISALVAATLAFGALPSAGGVEHVSSPLVGLDEFL